MLTTADIALNGRIAHHNRKRRLCLQADAATVADAQRPRKLRTRLYEGLEVLPDRIICSNSCVGIKNATGKEPIVIGKPSPLMPLLAMERLGIEKTDACVVGDRIYTDVKSGLNAGITGILVLSGETTREILEASEDKPHLVLQDAGEILTYLKNI